MVNKINDLSNHVSTKNISQETAPEKLLYKLRSDEETIIKSITGHTFENITLRNVTFQHECRDIMFSKSEIKESDFSETDLPEVTFTQSNISDTTFAKANIDEGVFQYTDISTSIFSEATITQSSFRQCHISKTPFNAVIFTGGLIKNSKLKAINWIDGEIKADIYNTEINSLSISNVSISDSYIEYTQIKESNLWTTIEDSELKGVRIIETEMNTLKLDNVIINNSSFDDSEIDTLEITDTDFNKCQFSDSKLEGGGMHSTNLNNSTFENTTILQMELKQVYIERTIFTETEFTKCVFDSLDAIQVTFPQIVNCSFKDSNIVKSRFDQQMMTDTTFTNTQLTAVDISQKDIKITLNQCYISNSSIRNSHEQVTIENTNIHNTVFRGLGDIDMANETYIESSRFENCTNIVFKDTDVLNTTLSKCDGSLLMVRCELKPHIQISDCEFQTQTITHKNQETGFNVIIEDTMTGACTISNCQFGTASIRHSIINSSIIRNTDLSSTQVTDSNIQAQLLKSPLDEDNITDSKIVTPQDPPTNGSFEAYIIYKNGVLRVKVPIDAHIINPQGGFIPRVSKVRILEKIPLENTQPIVKPELADIEKGDLIIGDKNVTTHAGGGLLTFMSEENARYYYEYRSKHHEEEFIAKI